MKARFEASMDTKGFSEQERIDALNGLLQVLLQAITDEKRMLNDGSGVGVGGESVYRSRPVKDESDSQKVDVVWNFEGL